LVLLQSILSCSSMWEHVTRITAGLNPQGTTEVTSDVRFVFLIRAVVIS